MSIRLCFVSFSICALSFTACGGSNSNASPTDGGAPDLAPPPAICKTPAGAHAQPWFADATAEVGLAATADLTPLGTSIQAVDLDNDGWVDLVTHIGTNVTREVMEAKRTNFVFMNRPSMGDPGKRVFVDFTKESGLLATRDGTGGRAIGVVNFGDLDGNGSLDAVVCPANGNSDDPCSALLNDGAAHFTLAPAGDLDTAGAWTCASAALLDYDRDGNVDYWPATFDQQNGMAPLLFKGSGAGGFSNVADKVGLPTDQGDPKLALDFPNVFGVTACDLDGDGDQDVLFADYGRALNRAWINDNGHFTENGIALGIASDDRVDYSDDQSYRCYCANHAGKCPMNIPAPAQGICDAFGDPQHDARGWTPGYSDQNYRLGGNTFSLTCGDLDNDGDLDLMTAAIRHGDVGSASDPTEILFNRMVEKKSSSLVKFERPGNAATGIDRPESGIDWNEGDMSPIFADVDNDGKKDIYLASSDYPGNHGWLWHQKADGTFENVTMPSGAGHKEIHGVALADIDNDGDLDLIAGTSTARGVAPKEAVKVYRNLAGQDQNFIQVRLKGLGTGHSNVSAIGARVRVTAGGVTQTQEVSGGWGHTALQNGYVLTFGLGANCQIDSIEVRWPNATATVQTFKEVRANYRVEITEGQGTVAYR